MTDYEVEELSLKLCVLIILWKSLDRQRLHTAVNNVLDRLWMRGELQKVARATYRINPHWKGKNRFRKNFPVD